MSLRLREPLRAAARALSLEAAGIDAAIASGHEGLEAGRRRLLGLRRRYFQMETILDFYGDAVSTRTNPRLAGVLRGLDTLASDSLDMVLRPLGIEAPACLVYVDKGLGASILRAGVRLWDQTSLSPVAAIKLTRHNLRHPTSLLHEVGHQVFHLCGWIDELRQAMAGLLARRSSELADVWSGWASEVAADVHAFAQAGWAPLPALANVVDGTTTSVYRLMPGDPHPFPWIRVMFNVQLCRAWYGTGPWDVLARAWWDRHPLERAPREAARLARASVDALDDIVELCTRTPATAFGGRSLAVLADPRKPARRCSARSTCPAASRCGSSPGWRPALLSIPSTAPSTISGCRSG